jgi:hypothetical protein
MLIYGATPRLLQTTRDFARTVVAENSQPDAQGTVFNRLWNVPPESVETVFRLCARLNLLRNIPVQIIENRPGDQRRRRRRPSAAAIVAALTSVVCCAMLAPAATAMANVRRRCKSKW